MEVPASSVRAALAQVWADHPKLREAMLAGETLRPYVRLMLRGRPLDPAQGLDTPLAPDDELAIFAPMGGG